MCLITLQNISKTYPNSDKPVVKDISFEVKNGEILTILGPSGSGKTTILRLISGFETPESGEIFVNKTLVCGGAKFIGPEKRGIGVVFQDYALFPHLSVKDNIGFGLSKLPQKERQKRIEEIQTLVGLSELFHRYPHELSGGQQQRVALARALAPKPHVILLDEPFSNLDTDLRSSMRRDVRNILKETETTAIFVTHDQHEAMSLSDRILVINEGNIEQIDHPDEVYHKPKNEFVASFMGPTNVFDGTIKNKQIETCVGTFPLNGLKADEKSVRISIRPESYTIVEYGKGIFRGDVVDVNQNKGYKEVFLKVKNSHGTYSRICFYVPFCESINVGDYIDLDVESKYVAIIEE